MSSSETMSFRFLDLPPPLQLDIINYAAEHLPTNQSTHGDMNGAASTSEVEQAAADESLVLLRLGQTSRYLRNSLFPTHWPNKLVFTLVGKNLSYTEYAEIRCVPLVQTTSCGTVALSQRPVPRSLQQQLVKDLNIDWKIFWLFAWLWLDDLLPMNFGLVPMDPLDREIAAAKLRQLYGDLGGVENLHIRISGNDCLDYLIEPSEFGLEHLADEIELSGLFSNWFGDGSGPLKAFWVDVLFKVMPSLRKVTLSRDFYEIDENDATLRKAIQAATPGYLESGRTVADWPLPTDGYDDYWPHPIIKLSEYPTKILAKADRAMCAQVNAWIDEKLQANAGPAAAQM